MFVHRRDVQIQWGDCDPANIVYYPRYFAMFDDSTSIMFEAAGFSKQDIIRKYGLVGIPMVDTRAKFHIPSTHGDWITIESRIESFKRSSFEVIHRVFKGEALAIEAFETRVLVGHHPRCRRAAAGANRDQHEQCGLQRRPRNRSGDRRRGGWGCGGRLCISDQRGVIPCHARRGGALAPSKR